MYRAKAHCATGSGRRQSAVIFLHRELEACDGFQDRTLRAWTHADLADLYRELEQEGEAHRHRERALRTATRIGLVALTYRLTSDDEHSGVRRLPPREREVPALVAEGLSDKEIAVRLGLAE